MVAGLVGGGFPNTYLIDLAANLALPPRVTELPVFMASKSNMEFASSFAPANPSVVQVSLQTAAGEKAAGGILPESRPTKANYDLHFECLSSGVTSIVWTLSVPQVDQKLDIVLLKQCGVTKPLPAFLQRRGGVRFFPVPNHAQEQSGHCVFECVGDLQDRPREAGRHRPTFENSRCCCVARGL